MEGPAQQILYNEETRKLLKEAGILPRIAHFIWSEIERNRKHFGKEIFIEVSALEIYCETIRDLLSPGTHYQFVDLKTINANKTKAVG